VPAPVPFADGAVGQVERRLEESAPPPGILREIGQRQTELTILELDIKRAELQRRLKELEIPQAAQLSSPPSALSTAAAPGFSAGGELGIGHAGGVTVRRIHKVGNQLMAQVGLPNGETKAVRSGAMIGTELRVINILPDGVLVQHGGEVPYSLPAPVSFSSGR
jgi:type IV pilus biogenesis protein PilP